MSGAFLGSNELPNYAIPITKIYMSRAFLGSNVTPNYAIPIT